MQWVMFPKHRLTFFAFQLSFLMHPVFHVMRFCIVPKTTLNNIISVETAYFKAEARLGCRVELSSLVHALFFGVPAGTKTQVEAIHTLHAGGSTVEERYFVRLCSTCVGGGTVSWGDLRVPTRSVICRALLKYLGLVLLFSVVVANWQFSFKSTYIILFFL